jgi:hypothetical protein
MLRARCLCPSMHACSSQTWYLCMAIYICVCVYIYIYIYIYIYRTCSHLHASKRFLLIYMLEINLYSLIKRLLWKLNMCERLNRRLRWWFDLVGTFLNVWTDVDVGELTVLARSWTFEPTLTLVIWLCWHVCERLNRRLRWWFDCVGTFVNVWTDVDVGKLTLLARLWTFEPTLTLVNWPCWHVCERFTDHQRWRQDCYRGGVWLHWGPWWVLYLCMYMYVCLLHLDHAELNYSSLCFS